MNDGTRVTAYKTTENSELRKIVVNQRGEVVEEKEYFSYDKHDINYNCVGKIADKEFNIQANDVSYEKLVKGEGYTPISIEDAQPGDIGIYYSVGKKDGRIKIIHFESVDENGTIDTKGGIEAREEGVTKNKLGKDEYFLEVYDDMEYADRDDYEIKYQLYRPKENNKQKNESE